jgi:dCTP deaminase
MLNGEEVRAALEHADDKQRLIVLPRPEAKAFDGSSLDLRLGRWFVSFRQTQVTSVPLAKMPPRGPKQVDANVLEKRRTRQYFVPFGESYILHPGAFVLGSTLEWMCLPPNLSAYVTGKSSLGRHGLVIETASGIHPGFSGCLTLEIANVGEVPLEIFPGMLICQVFFHASAARSEATSSKFAGRRKPHLGTIEEDDRFTLLVKGEKRTS